ncbi:MAG TPA: hypothetical protein PLA50_07155 [Bacteroidia bacterium]|nr:hypothetical protein [Bacteroidia bacterium]
MKLIDPALGIKLIVVGGWCLAALGALKVVLYLVGEFVPNAYAWIKSEGLRRFLTGKGNRLLFGVGGAATVLLGLVFVGIGHGLRYLQTLF